MPTLVEPSNLSGFAGNYIGRARAFVEVQIRKKVFEIQDELLEEVCPLYERLKEIVGIKDNLIQVVDGFQTKIQPIRELIEPLDDALGTLSTIIETLRNIPIPSTVGLPPPVGGVIFSIPVGTINKLNDILQTVGRILSDLSGDVDSIYKILAKVDGKLDEIKGRLDSIDLPLLNCVLELPEDQRKELIDLINNLPGQDQLDNGQFTYTSKAGIEYDITIETDPDSPAVAPLRFAVAKDPDGKVIARGTKSFSSSTQVLIDEIKFRIENQLL